MNFDLIASLITLILIVVASAVYWRYIKTPKSPLPNPSPKPSPPVKFSLADNSRYIIPYLQVCYPAVSASSWASLSTADIRKLYQSLNWYYLPVVDDVGSQSLIHVENNKQLSDIISRRAPLAGPYVNQWTEAFLSDSTDQQIFREAPYNNIKCKTDSDCSLGGQSGTCSQGQCQFKCIGAVDDPFNPNPPCNQYCFGDNKDPEKCQLCCESGNICNPDGNCQSNATSSFCSVFPSTLPNSQGPLWNSGAKACSLDMLDGKTTSQECIARLYGMDADGKSLCGQKNPSFGPLCANKGAMSYQFITLIQPYARKQGCPNYGYMEQVAYVCEGTGRQLLYAPSATMNDDPSNPEWVGIFGRNKFCGVSCSLGSEGVDSETAWKQCQDSAVDWKKSRGINPIVENFEMFDNVYDRAYSADFEGVDAEKNTGNLRGTSLGPSGCTFVGGWNVFKAKGANGKGIWVPKDNTLKGYINGNAILDNETIPASMSLKDTYSMGNCVQHPNYVNLQVGKSKLSPNNCADKTMFYWEAGYGKFLNLGKTGIYQNYIHFFLTIPNGPFQVPSTIADIPDKTVYYRACLPEVLSMGVGSSALQSLQNLIKPSRLRDKRRYLQGFCTTFQNNSPLGRKYGLIPSAKSAITGKTVPMVYDFNAKPSDWNTSVIVITGRMYWAKQWGAHCDPMNHGKVFPASKNTWFKEDIMSEPPGVENSNGLFNPQEGINDWMTNYLKTKDYNSIPDNFVGDPNLCAVASQCIQCYYPPNLNIVNPHYNQECGMDIEDAFILWQGMYIYGDTGGDQYGYSEDPFTCKQLGANGCESFPYGSYYFSAAIGSCVYALTVALGWITSQFACMSTGGGNEKFCTYPGYDYEIVYIGNRNAMVSNADPYYSFKLVDITAGGQKKYLDFYTKYGYVQGSFANGESNSIDDMKTRLDSDTKLYNVMAFDACKMPLSEQNVDPTVWGDKLPNMMFYDEPQGQCDWTDPSYESCIKKGGNPSTWVYSVDGKITPCRDCPYKDATGAIRDTTNCKHTFVPKWMLKDSGGRSPERRHHRWHGK